MDRMTNDGILDTEWLPGEYMIVFWLTLMNLVLAAMAGCLLIAFSRSRFAPALVRLSLPKDGRRRIARTTASRLLLSSHDFDVGAVGRFLTHDPPTATRHRPPSRHSIDASS